MNDESQGLDKIFPINKGDNFRLGPYHFVCMGWKNGRILATRYEKGQGIIEHSLIPDLMLSPGFEILSRSKVQMDYKEKCAYIAAHAKGRIMTAEEVDAEIQEALKHPLLALFMDAESLADATIAQIKKEQESE